MDDVHGHIPVLLQEVLTHLAPAPGDVVVDCTAGRGGHAVELATAVGSDGVLVICDLDAGNLAYAADRARPRVGTLHEFRGSFVGIPRRLRELDLAADVVLVDLGFASNQVDSPERGLAFAAEGPLDMRLDPSGPVTAADLIATASEAELRRIIGEYGEEPLAGRIARKLVSARDGEPIQETTTLARLVREAYGTRARTSRLHPATRTFMALRIAVNDELGALRSLLDLIGRSAAATGERWLRPGARVGIISFHSLEDRLVKRAFADLERRGVATRVTKRPVTAGDEEIQANSRSRSAKLRVVTINEHVDGTRM